MISPLSHQRVAYFHLLISFSISNASTYHCISQHPIAAEPPRDRPPPSPPLTMISRSSSGTLNELDISLCRRPRDRPFYICGDEIKGDIILRNPNTAFGVEAAVKFVGVARTKIGSRINIHQPQHSSETTLFQYIRDLGTGSKTAEGTVWPFEFHFPSGTQSGSTIKNRYSGDQNFHRNPGHSLPPSFRGGPRPTEMENGVVRYTVEAIVTKPYSTHPFPGTLRYGKPIPFCPVRDTENHQPILSPIAKTLTVSCSLSQLYTSESDTALNPSVQTRDLSFTINTHTPNSTCAGSKLPIKIGVAHDLTQHSLPAIPPVYLRSVHIDLESITKIRTPALYLGLGQEPQECWTEKSKIAESGPINIPLSESWDVQELIKNMNVSDIVTPTFKTFNIARTYTLQVAVEVQCLERKINFNVERQLIILPAAWKTQNRSAAWRTAIPRARRRNSTLEEPPPPYEEHEGAAAVASGTRGCIHRLPSFRTAVLNFVAISGTAAM